MAYEVIVIDPPWEIKKLTSKQRPKQVNMDYEMMSIEKIKSMDINNLASDNSWCFLWTTQKYLWDAREILESWGFKYLFLMTWKKEFGISAGIPLFGFRWNSEFVLVGSKGKKDLWVKGKPLINLCFSGINKGHSIKPLEFYKMIEQLGDKRLDIFAREKKDGWDVWGNEVESDIEIKFMNSKSSS